MSGHGRPCVQKLRGHHQVTAEEEDTGIDGGVPCNKPQTSREPSAVWSEGRYRLSAAVWAIWSHARHEHGPRSWPIGRVRHRHVQAKQQPPDVARPA